MGRLANRADSQMTTATEWLDRIRALPLPAGIKVMNVCGGHERSISLAGLRKAIPSSIELVPGPGCPVCICPEEDIYEAMQLALHEGVILLAYGDMLRVPVNAPKSEPRSLEQAKAAGADGRPLTVRREPRCTLGQEGGVDFVDVLAQDLDCPALLRFALVPVEYSLPLFSR